MYKAFFYVKRNELNQKIALCIGGLPLFRQFISKQFRNKVEITETIG